MAAEESFISKLQPRTQLAIFGVLILGLAAVFYTYYIGPLSREVAELEGATRELTRQVAQGRQVQAQLAKVKANIEQQRMRLQQLQQVLPDDKETARIIRTVQELAGVSDLRIKSFVAQRTVNRSFYEDWPILISLEGNYESLGIFFEKVSEMARIVNIDDITITALEESDNRRRTLSATCTATTFVYLEQPETTPSTRASNHANERF